MKSRYNILRSIIYGRAGLSAFTVDLYSTATYTLEFNDLNAPGFCIVGFNGSMVLMDDSITDYYFNTKAESGVFIRWELAPSAANLFGDNFNITSLPAGIIQGNLSLDDGVHYDYINTPVYVTGNVLIVKVRYGVFGYTPGGTLKYQNTFKLDIGYQDDSGKARDFKTQIIEQ